MRGPLREQIQNAINRALHESLGHSLGDSQSAYINVGGRRRNRKKKSKNNKKNNGKCGSAWSILRQISNEPPVRSCVDIPPKAKCVKGSSPQVTKTKKTCKDIKDTCKELKARLTPPRCRKDNADQDDRPLIDDDEDDENTDPNKMPLSDLFKTTKAKKKNKKKDGTDTNSVASDDVSNNKAVSEAQHEEVVAPAEPLPEKTEEVAEETEVTDNGQSEALVAPVDESEAKAATITEEEISVNVSGDGKTDVKAGGDSAAVLYTSDSRQVTMAAGEGPQLTQKAGVDTAGAETQQPVKVADGTLPPETGREGQSLLHEHNPEGMICCTIL